jgi:hypothetical protein
MKPTGERALPEYNLSTARNLSPLFDTVVGDDQPVLITRNKKERAVLLSFDLLMRLADRAVHVDVVPEESGAFTLWVRELNVGATGADLLDARAKLLDTVRAYVADYVAQSAFYRHFSDLAAQEPVVRRLSFATTDDELIGLLFGTSDAAPTNAARTPGAA